MIRLLKGILAIHLVVLVWAIAAPSIADPSIDAPKHAYCASKTQWPVTWPVCMIRQGMNCLAYENRTVTREVCNWACKPGYRALAKQGIEGGCYLPEEALRREKEAAADATAAENAARERQAIEMRGISTAAAEQLWATCKNGDRESCRLLSNQFRTATKMPAAVTRMSVDEAWCKAGAFGICGTLADNPNYKTAEERFALKVWACDNGEGSDANDSAASICNEVAKAYWNRDWSKANFYAKRAVKVANSRPRYGGYRDNSYDEALNVTKYWLKRQQRSLKNQ